TALAAAADLHIMSMKMKISPTTQSGNALWFILIGAVLLGLLTMVLSRGTSSVEQTGSFEQRTIATSQLLRYASGIEQDVQQLNMNGCSESDISFQNTSVAGYGAGTANCRVFEVSGAGQSWQDITGESAALLGGEGLMFTDSLNVPGVGRDDGPDLVMLAAVSQAMCAQINTSRSISGTITTTIDNVELYENGSDAFDDETFNLVDDGQAIFNGQASGCFTDDNGDAIFYQVVLAR
ncbi:MAG: hypothetical protein KTR28_08560, partial [Micavibrio sp.]|nr:hypothetical protein [Micavibrio sp.]